MTPNNAQRGRPGPDQISLLHRVGAAWALASGRERAAMLMMADVSVECTRLEWWEFSQSNQRAIVAGIEGCLMISTVVRQHIEQEPVQEVLL